MPAGLRIALLSCVLAHAAGLRAGGGRAAARVRASAARVHMGASPAPRYCESVYTPTRRPTRTVWVGKVPIGSEHPIAIQTMTTTDTRDVEASVEQIIRCADAGADLVRLTVQGMQEARACALIKARLLERGYETPLVADIHFAPKVALLVAESFDKIRVNPGNFMDGRKTFEEKSYDDETAYARELEAIEELFTPLVLKCKELGRAMRIGTNHGSLSARTLGKFGDTPAGMVESAFEFARICRKLDYHNFVFSMKASNPLVMAAAYRLLAAEMYKEGWDYPLHLGVTEAGEGEDGRIKSAIGIGSLLQDGLGDTVRVSLTEDPEFEMGPCTILRDAAQRALATPSGVRAYAETSRDFTSYERRRGTLPEQRERDGDFDMRGLLHRDGSVLLHVTRDELRSPAALYTALGCKTAVGFPFKDIATVDSIVLDAPPTADDADARLTLRRLQTAGVGVLAPAAALGAAPIDGAVAIYDLAAIGAAGGALPALPAGALRAAVRVDGSEDDELLLSLARLDAAMIILDVATPLSRVHASRRVFEMLARSKCAAPVILAGTFETPSAEELTIAVGMQLGSLLVDGLGDGVLVSAPRAARTAELRPLSFALLQGSRMRNTKTEFVSCPSCGRTLFDLQTVTAEIAARTGHLPGVAIAVMGCIVNGPGEMADADFGYVGGAPGKIDLYVGKDVVKRAIPMEQACEELVQLIKDNGRWVEKEPAEAEAVAVAA
ncbi:hypothetical protein KFE25_010095 [Diacronema lutheri]|uniref:4-hydroxy-3-methylbut-2-en-1-yl diphosphate synthase (ferredoxin), chloroplastic n=2 Tax=Diacronema lutheri TaxID=2081491 RepID=A0A8J5XID9_DIALT|nr:hypothetical protein KFE25_010095 [Diacronema lutheri]